MSATLGLGASWGGKEGNASRRAGVALAWGVVRRFERLATCPRLVVKNTLPIPQVPASARSSAQSAHRFVSESGLGVSDIHCEPGGKREQGGFLPRKPPDNSFWVFPVGFPSLPALSPLFPSSPVPSFSGRGLLSSPVLLRSATSFAAPRKPVLSLCAYKPAGWYAAAPTHTAVVHGEAGLGPSRT
ncbi:hypothetical protein MAPG_07301 [Magnaporthiopsis poae ATCC 64411]|uniref:Uncharacterized protein n=1 Tax=Magnaporthiopsis poae (strain ATCC 64411 / 73-15) TaxID=644358 RepID=A0A0C4E4A9_MAGP6|nr:hypothetical protein MAPG_07301 [Magnaporthiopsis poae ATCC 64411]